MDYGVAHPFRFFFDAKTLPGLLFWSGLRHYDALVGASAALAIAYSLYIQPLFVLTQPTVAVICFGVRCFWCSFWTALLAYNTSGILKVYYWSLMLLVILQCISAQQSKSYITLQLT